jgi:hypothetical protein
VRGTIITPFHKEAGLTTLMLHLRAWDYRTSNRESQESAAFIVAQRDVMLTQIVHEAKEARISVDLPIPEGSSPTREHKFGGATSGRWRLRLEQSLPGRINVATFEIPVGPADAEVRETGGTRALKRRLRQDLSVFDEPADPAEQRPQK